MTFFFFFFFVTDLLTSFFSLIFFFLCYWRDGFHFLFFFLLFFYLNVASFIFFFLFSFLTFSGCLAFFLSSSFCAHMFIFSLILVGFFLKTFCYAFFYTLISVYLYIILFFLSIMCYLLLYLIGTWWSIYTNFVFNKTKKFFIHQLFHPPNQTQMRKIKFFSILPLLYPFCIFYSPIFLSSQPNEPLNSFIVVLWVK